MSDLRVSFRAGYGAGNTFGVFLLADRRARACAMTRPIIVSPLDAAGRLSAYASPLVSRPASRPLILADMTAAQKAIPAGEVARVESQMAGSTGGALSGGCPTDRYVVPVRWKVTLQGHSTVVPNGHGSSPHVFVCHKDGLRLHLGRQIAAPNRND
jgi:hypothetical protein